MPKPPLDGTRSSRRPEIIPATLPGPDNAQRRALSIGIEAGLQSRASRSNNRHSGFDPHRPPPNIPKSKLCSHCRQVLPRKKFNRDSKRRDRTQNTCRECNRAAFKKYYAHAKDMLIARKHEREQLLKDFVINYLETHPCIDCGERDIVVLEFDHRDPDDKERDVYMFIKTGRSLAAMMAEIAKCDVRCANCHRRKTALQRGSYRLLRVPPR